MSDNIIELLDVHQAAKRLNVSERFIRRIVAERRIAVHRIGRHVRLRADDIESFIAAARQEPRKRRPW